MSEDLNKKIEELASNNRVLNAQIAAHKDVIREMGEQNLHLRANFNLSQGYLQESLKKNEVLGQEIDSLKKSNDSLTQELDGLKKANDNLTNGENQSN